MVSDPFDRTIEVAPPRARERIGPYRVIDVLGGGGMGIVYRAEAPDGAAVALKTLRADLFDPAAAARFEREASIRIDHPNVVRVLDAGCDADGTPYVALELLEGEALDDRIARAPLDPRETVSIARQIAAGLGAAHALGYVHRDLKPANVFLCADGVAKLLDFGIARSVGRSSMTASGAVLGTPAYLAPEQASGRRDLDGRADVWAFGVMLYEMLTGVSPFRRDTWAATAVAVMVDEPRPLAELRSPLPRGLSDLVRRCMLKDRQGRPSDAEALAEALAALDLDAPTESHAPRATLARGEQRVVAVVLARAVSDAAAFDAVIREAGGEPLDSPGLDRIALFGATRWEGDEVRRAVATALACRRIAERVGVGSGRVNVSDTGVAGAVLESASRAAACEVTGVVLDDATSSAVGDGFETRALGSGLTEVVRAFVPSTRSSVAEDPLRLVGRDVELGQLRAISSAAFAEHRPTVVSLLGAAGVGKSRLVRELIAQLGAGDEMPRVLVGRGEPTRREADLALLASALRARASELAWREGLQPLDAEHSDDRRRLVELLAAEATADAGCRASMTPFLAELLGVQWPGDPRVVAARADPRLMADRLRLALEDWLVGLVAGGPLLLLLEDAQWADVASIELVERVVESLGAGPCVVVVAARDEAEEALRGAFASLPVSTIRLAGLGTAALRELVGEIGAQGLPDDALRALAERTQGNPLFVIEILRSVGNTLVLSELSAALPLSVEAAIQGRLDRLPPGERELCKRASVLGGSFDARELGALGLEGTEASLRSLRRTDVLALVAGSDPRNPRYRFRSAMVAEVAYRLVAPELVRIWHLAAARSLQGLASAEPEEVGSHWERGGDAVAAAASYASAAMIAARRGDSHSTLRCSERALALDPGCARFELRLARADALRFLGRRGEQSQELDAALALAREERDRALVLLERVAWLTRAGRLEDALAAADDVQRTSQQLGDPALRCLALVRSAEVQTLLHHEPEAAALLEEARTVAGDADALACARVQAAAALAAATRGDIGLAHRGYAEALSRYRELGDARRAAANAQNLADVLNRVGAFAEAEHALIEALADCRRVGHRLAEGWASANLGYAQAMQGRSGDALASLSRAGDLARATGDRRLAVASDVYTAVALIVDGRPEQAVPLARHAASRAEALGLVGMQVDALVAASRACLESGDAARALVLALEAHALREKLGTPVESEGELWLTLARAAAACGDAEVATDARARGLDAVRAMEAKIEDAQWRERLQRDVPAHRALRE